MSQQKRFYAEANGIKLHYLEFGSDSGAPTLLILPSMAGVAETQRFIAEALTPYAHIIVMDYRGRGLSDHRAGLSYTLDDYAADADGLLECLGVPSAMVLGHSMGGRVGIRMATTYPDRVSRLIVVDPPLCGPKRQYDFPVEDFLESIREAAQGRTSEEPPPWAAHWTREQLSDRVKWLPTCSEESMVASYRGLNEEDIHANIPAIACPTLMLFADEGMVVPNDHIAEFSDAMTNPNIRVQQMANVGHMIPWDDLDQFVTRVSEHITEPSAI